MKYDDYEFIRFEQNGGALTMRLNRPAPMPGELEKNP